MKIRSILNLCVGLILGTLLFEGLMRLDEFWPIWKVAPVTQASFYGPDPNTGYTHRPNSDGFWMQENRAWHRVNRKGYLGPAVSDIPSEDTLRIAVVGDSVTESLQVPDKETFIRQAESQLNQDGQAIELLNLGLAGATIAVSAARIDHLVLAQKPGFIVLFLSASGFLSAAPGDDSAFPAYVKDTHGNIVRGTGYRLGRGFQLRSSEAGEVLYWLLDNVRVANIVNNRKNVGFFAEIETPTRPEGGAAKPIAKNCALERDELTPTQQAILKDISTYPDGTRPRLILAVTNLSGQCASDAERRHFVQQLSAAFSQTQASSWVIDWDARLSDNLPKSVHDLSALAGFGRGLGRGHLNETGHAVYAAALVDVIRKVVEAGS